MENDRNPHRRIGNWYVDVRKILCRPARITQLEDAVPDEQARHQQACKRRQVGFHGVHGSSLPTSRPERASYWLKPAPGKGAVQRPLGSTTGFDPKSLHFRFAINNGHTQERSEYPKVPNSGMAPSAADTLAEWRYSIDE